MKIYSFIEFNFDFKGIFEEEFEKIKLREEEIKKVNNKLKNIVEKFLKIFLKLEV